MPDGIKYKVGVHLRGQLPTVLVDLESEYLRRAALFCYRNRKKSDWATTCDRKQSVIDHIHSEMQQGDNLLFGGRRVKTLLESTVERPLNRWIFENIPDAAELSGRALLLSMADAQLTVSIKAEAKHAVRS